MHDVEAAKRVASQQPTLRAEISAMIVVLEGKHGERPPLHVTCVDAPDT